MLSYRSRRSYRGIALVLVIVMMLVLFIAAESLVTLSGHDIFRTRLQHHRNVALFAAESAIARCSAELGAQVDWTAGFQDEPLENVAAFYTVKFNTSGLNIQPDESINNLTGATAVDGPRGSGSVPPFSVDLVVTARAGSVERSFEVLLSRGLEDPSPFALISSRNILMRGNIEVDGLESVGSDVAIDAGIHSNRPDSAADVIQWQPKNLGDTAVVAGTVSTSSPLTDAIDFGSNPGAFSLGGTETSAAAKPVPPIDVASEVAGKASAPSPDLSQPISGGDFYLSGDTVYNGDIELDGGSLYIDGNFTVNGSISGKGGIYVNGETAFKGDSEMQAGNESGVSLYSKGSVRLTGFDGSEFLDNLAATDPNAASPWTDLKNTFSDLKTYVEGGGDDAILIKKHLAVISEEDALPPVAGRQRRTTQKLRDLLAASATPGSTEEFLVKRLDRIGRQFCCYNHNTMNSRPSGQAMNEWLTGGDDTGIFAAVANEGAGDHWGAMKNLLSQTNYDKIGTSFFQGVIYTNGYIYAANEVNVVGAVFAEDDGSQAAAMIGGETVEPGDIFLDNNSRFTFVQDYVESVGGGGTAPVTTRVWMEL